MEPLERRTGTSLGAPLIGERAAEGAGGSGSPLLKVTELGTSYGEHQVVSGVTFELAGGQILGLLGAAGSGKTTLLRTLATVVGPTTGSIELDGRPLQDLGHSRSIIGYLPDFIGGYEDMTVDDYLEFFARGYMVPRRRRRLARTEALSSTGLADLGRRRVGELAADQAQRLALCRVLMHDPKLLLLDEPAGGLGPAARQELHAVIESLREAGKAVIISAAHVEELGSLPTQIAVLDGGTLVCHGAREEIYDRLGKAAVS